MPLGRPTYPLDRATFRILARHGWIETTTDYDEARDVVDSALGDRPSSFSRWESATAEIGLRHCKAQAPRCESCPLKPWLPEGGPVSEGADSI